MQKNTAWPLCSIFSNSGHVFSTNQKSPQQFYAGYTKEHSHQVWFQLIKYCQRRRVLYNCEWRRTPRDGNSSHSLWPDELKTEIDVLVFKKLFWTFSHDIFLAKESLIITLRNHAVGGLPQSISCWTQHESVTYSFPGQALWLNQSL